MACPRGRLAREQVGLGDRFRVGGVPSEPQPGPHSHRGHGVEAQRGGVPVPELPCLGCRTLTVHSARAQLCGPARPLSPGRLVLASVALWAYLFLDPWNLLSMLVVLQPSPCGCPSHFLVL